MKKPTLCRFNIKPAVNGLETGQLLLIKIVKIEGVTSKIKEA